MTANASVHLRQSKSVQWPDIEAAKRWGWKWHLSTTMCVYKYTIVCLWFCGIRRTSNERKESEIWMQWLLSSSSSSYIHFHVENNYHGSDKHILINKAKVWREMRGGETWHNSSDSAAVVRWEKQFFIAGPKKQLVDLNNAIWACVYFLVPVCFHFLLPKQSNSRSFFHRTVN